MRLPADVPLVRGEDIDSLFAIELDARDALVVASRDGTGTNAIVRTPPTLFPSRFGPNSLALHRADALRIGVELRVIANESIALDIDEPSDVELLLRLGAGTEAHRVATAMNIKGRRQAVTTPADKV
jgi:2-phospho-L-lactate guanylyltransferase